MSIYEPQVTFRAWRRRIRTRYIVELLAALIVVAGLVLLLFDDENTGAVVLLAGFVLFALARIISWVRHGSRNLEQP